jgi:hypothetical protein
MRRRVLMRRVVRALVLQLHPALALP